MTFSIGPGSTGRDLQRVPFSKVSQGGRRGTVTKPVVFCATRFPIRIRPVTIDKDRQVTTVGVEVAQTRVTPGGRPPTYSD